MWATNTKEMDLDASWGPSCGICADVECDRCAAERLLAKSGSMPTPEEVYAEIEHTALTSPGGEREYTDEEIEGIMSDMEGPTRWK
jgi:hypothetical protein